MNPQQTGEEILTYEVSDEILETAGTAMIGGAVTLIQGSYCFTCAQGQQRVETRVEQQWHSLANSKGP
jgi:hypothetical protein